MVLSRIHKVMMPKSFRKILCGIVAVVIIYWMFISSLTVSTTELSQLPIPYPLLDLTLFQTDLYNDDLNLVITDLDVMKCVLRNCKVPSGFTKLQPPLNHHRLGQVNLKYIYYVVVKKQNINQATKILTGINLEGPGENVVIDGFSFFKSYTIVNPANPVPQDLPLVRNVDVLFGSNDMADSRKWWNQVHLSRGNEIHPIISLMSLSAEQQPIHIDYWRNWNTIKSEMTMHATKDFKVLQISDLHFGSTLGHCYTESNCTSDFRTIKFLENTIVDEKPNLVIITGDLIDVHRSYDYKSVILKALQPILQHEIAFVFTFGDEIGSNTNENLSRLTKLKILEFLETLPNCLNSKAIDKDTHGLTNYNLQVISNSNEVASVTILDSANRQLDDSQINYLYRLHKQGDSMFKMLFFHYPIPQFRPSGKFKIVGSYNEKHPLSTASKEQFRNDIMDCGYQVIAVGHEHENDACILSEHKDKKVWLCYSSVAGDSATTNAEYSRKVRLFEVNFPKGELLLWKRNEVDKTGFDYQMIYKVGA